MKRKTKIRGNGKVKGNGKISSYFASSVPDPEVVEKSKRRKFTAKYKLKILKEVDSMTEPGEFGALLRREGLYHSNIATWKWQREKGELEGLKGKKRGPKEKSSKELERKLDKLERENKRLKKRLEKAEMIIDVQKKISEICGIPLKEVEREEKEW